MLFNSLNFAIFFPTVFFLFFLLPRRFQWLLLLAASAYFYMAFVPKYILVLFFLIVVDYFLGLVIERADGERRTLLLWVSIASNLGTLFLFKYFNFFNENIATLANAIGWNYSIESLKLILPLGLSFHIFQSLSYVIEVYRRKHPAERHFGIYALYVMFFPQLVAGPIERPQNLLPQLHLTHDFDYERVMDGLTLMLWGFFKKLVIADQLAVTVDHVYGNLYEAPPTALLIAAIFFTFQLYCDFSGYGDIAVGAARVLGFTIINNFARPFQARSISEFWRRQHISLSNWLRDYLYYPLAIVWRSWGRVGSYTALFVTMVLIGLWHGANWTFVIFGVLHGAYLVIGDMGKAWRGKVMAMLGVLRFPQIHHAVQVLVTFCLFSFSLIFFRAPTVDDARHIIVNLPDGIAQLFGAWDTTAIAAALGVPATFLLLRLAAIVFMLLVERYMAAPFSAREYLLRWSLTWRLAAYYFIILWIFFLGSFGAKSFIYFQF